MCDSAPKDTFHLKTHILLWTLLVLALWAGSYFAIQYLSSTGNFETCKACGHMEHAGQMGDQFGAVNALFTGLAFAGVIIALLYQQHEFKQALREHEELTEATEDQVKQLKRQNNLSQQQITFDVYRSLLEINKTYFDLLVDAEQALARGDRSNMSAKSCMTMGLIPKRNYNDRGETRKEIASELKLMAAKMEAYRVSMSKIGFNVNPASFGSSEELAKANG